jgi:hypothetical protein
MPGPFVWINTSGETACGERGHGGGALEAALEAGLATPMAGDPGHLEVATGLSHWIGFPGGRSVLGHERLECEWCEREREEATTGN